MGLLSKLLAVVLALAPPAAWAVDSPFVWEVQGPHARHCLVGTVHALPGSARFLPENIEACYQRSTILVVEALSSTILEDSELLRRLTNITESRPGGLRAQIGDAQYARLAAMATALGLPASRFDQFRAWYAAELLLGFRAVSSSARVGYGVDSQLYGMASQDRRKSIVALETDPAHAAWLTQMPDDASVQHLAATLDGITIDSPSAQGSIATWLAGDVSELDKQQQELHDKYPAYYRRLQADRNRAWLPRLNELLDGAQPCLVALHMTHFAGPDNLRQQLWKEKRRTPQLRSPERPVQPGVPLP